MVLLFLINNFFRVRSTSDLELYLGKLAESVSLWQVCRIHNLSYFLSGIGDLRDFSQTTEMCQFISIIYFPANLNFSVNRDLNSNNNFLQMFLEENPKERR